MLEGGWGCIVREWLGLQCVYVKHAIHSVACSIIIIGLLQFNLKGQVPFLSVEKVWAAEMSSFQCKRLKPQEIVFPYLMYCIAQCSPQFMLISYHQALVFMFQNSMTHSDPPSFMWVSGVGRAKYMRSTVFRACAFGLSDLPITLWSLLTVIRLWSVKDVIYLHSILHVSMICFACILICTNIFPLIDNQQIILF